MWLENEAFIQNCVGSLLGGETWKDNIKLVLTQKGCENGMWMQTVQDCGTSSADQLSKSYASTAFRNSQLSHRLMPSGQGSIHNVVQFHSIKTQQLSYQLPFTFSWTISVRCCNIVSQMSECTLLLRASVTYQKMQVRQFCFWKNQVHLPPS